MVKQTLKLSLLSALLALTLGACSSSSLSSNSALSDTSAEATEVQTEDAEFIQLLLPAIDTSLSLVSNQAPSTSLSLAKPILLDDYPLASSLKYSIGAWNTPDDFPDTPEDLFTDATYDVAGETYKRYPATGYLEDFYGIDGYKAYAELRETDDDWGDYQVTLYVYPTLSSSIRYEKEVYRVPADDWTYLVDQTTGEYSAIAFEEIYAKYFDNRSETRTLHWTRYVDGQIYDKSEFSVPSDFDDAAYTYPATITEPGKVAARDTDDFSEYASHSTVQLSSQYGDCDSQPYYCITDASEEFYNEALNDNDNREIYSKSFNKRTIKYVDNDKSITDKTNYLSHTDENGVVIARSKTVTTLSGFFKEDQIITVVVETENGDKDNNGRTDYSLTMTVDAPKKGSKEVVFNDISYVVDLEETAVDSNAYSGTLTITQGKTDYQYTATLDAFDGLALVASDKDATKVGTKKIGTEDMVVTFFTNMEHFAGEGKYPKVSLSVGNNELSAAIESGNLHGELVDKKKGKKKTLLIGKGYLIQVDESGLDSDDDSSDDDSSDDDSSDDSSSDDSSSDDSSSDDSSSDDSSSDDSSSDDDSSDDDSSDD